MSNWKTNETEDNIKMDLGELDLKRERCMEEI
jgi:hypothetical protein